MGNNTQELVADIETLRLHLGVEQVCGVCVHARACVCFVTNVYAILRFRDILFDTPRSGT